MARDEALAAYLEEARGWDLDRGRAAERAARRAWWIAGIATGAAVLAVAAVLALTPLKTVEPFVIRVDNTTGVVDVVPRYDGTLPATEAVTRHLLTQYVTLRERYVGALAESDYREVGAYHSAGMNQAWAAAWDRTNPESPLNRYRDGRTVRVQVTAVTFIARANGIRDLAQVRFLRAERMGSAAEQVSHYIATVQYGYGAPSSDVRLRALNPLGFKVLEYRREAEVVEATRGGGMS